MRRMRHHDIWGYEEETTEYCNSVFSTEESEDAPDQICQVALNFICSMQFNTFRQVQGVPAATTFVTNHIRQVGHFLARTRLQAGCMKSIKDR